MSSTLQIAHLIKGLGRGGAERLIPQAIRAASDDVTYAVGYFLPSKNALVAEIEAAGAPVRCFGAPSNAALLASVPQVAEWLYDKHPDLVHAHLPLAGVVARLAGCLAGVPVVYTEHNLQERYHPLTRRANGLTWRWQERAIAVSAEVETSIVRHMGARVPVSVVRNGIEVVGPSASEEDLAGLRRQIGIPEGAPVVGTVAVLRVQKRLDLWLAAAARILDRRPETRFVIVGDGPLRPELERTAEASGIASSVHFAGLQDEVAPYLALFDLFLSSSEFEGLPLALLEAMAAGVPVVATAVGGVPEVIEDGRDGVLVPFGDPESLADRILGLLADPDRCARLAAAGRERVRREFSVKRMARELEAIYLEVLRERRGP